MKKIISIFLLSIILAQTFSSFVYDAAYSLNKKYIADNFCVNKEKPAMHCDGHCFLSKQKQQEENNDKPSTESKREKFEVSAYELPVSSTENSNAFLTRFDYNHIVRIVLPGYASSVFRPPLV